MRQFTQISKRQDQPPVSGKSADDLIRECQAIVARFLPPDSGITREECLDRLLEVLDGPDAQRFGEH